MPLACASKPNPPKPNGPPPQKKKVDSTVEAVERLRLQREQRRSGQEEAKKNKIAELEDQKAHGRVGDIDFCKMINEYRQKRGTAERQHQPPGAYKITICVRKRPINPKEISHEDYDAISVYNPEVVVHECKLKVDGITKYLVNHQFAFDHAFSENIDSDFVYLYTAKPLVDFVMNSGGNATCFAYGQTGSGKTYTMLTIQKMAAQEIFRYLGTPEFRDKKLTISYFEIYGGRLLDLLNQRKKVCLMEDGNHKIQIPGLLEIEANTVEDLLSLMEHAARIRTTAATEVHDQSSRSHAICFINIKDQTDRLYGKLALIDLAGSERASETQNHNRQKRIEGAEINKSLLALKECIRALDSGGVNVHIPYRASKLTQVLKDTFEGKAKACMICTTSPAASSADHTLNTLRYADRIKQKDVSEAMDMPFIEEKTDVREEKSDFVPKLNPSKEPRIEIRDRHKEVREPRAEAKDESDSPDPDSNEEEDLKDIEILCHSVQRSNKEATQTMNVHTAVLLLIAEEEKLLQSHMRSIQESAELLTEEGQLLAKIQGDDVVDYDIDAYAERLEEILDRKINMNMALRRQLQRFRRQLQREEMVSKQNNKLPEY